MIIRPTEPLTTSAPSEDGIEEAVGGRNGSPKEEDKHVWEVDDGASKNYGRFGERMAACPDLYRNTSEGHGLVLVLPSGKTRLLKKASDLAPVIADHIPMVVMKEQAWR